MEREQLTQLHQILTEGFNEGELRTLCFNLDIDYESLGGAGKSDKARELVEHFERRQQTYRLVKVVGKLRPDISWPNIPETIPNAATIPNLSNLPRKTYHRFIGRFDELDQAKNALKEQNRKPIVAIVGLGGIGKTAMVREIVEHCDQEKIFESIVWVSFKTEQFVGEKISQENDKVYYDFDSLLNDIGQQCNLIDIVSMSLKQKRTAITNLLAKRRVLVVLDNLDTVPNKEELIQEVFSILGNSQLLITSRWKVEHEQVFTLNLLGFPEEESIVFLREESRERNVIAVSQAESNELREIHHVTGGAPLALKLVLGQMIRLPMKTVLNTLKRAAANGQNEAFYRFIYWQSWDLLEDNSRIALVEMAAFPPNIGGTSEDVEKISDLEPRTFWMAMDQLSMMSLVEKAGTAGKEHYALHTLTHHFILSDITERW